MSDDLVPLEDPADDPRGDQMFQMIMAGQSPRAIAKSFGCTSKEVERACLARLPTVDEASVRKRFRLQLAYMESLQLAFFTKALRDECTASATIALKANERLSAMLGYDAPRPTQPITVTVEPTPNSTEKIRRVIDNLIGKRPQPAPPDDPDALPLPPAS
jgi:hypothetical protein